MKITITEAAGVLETPELGEVDLYTTSVQHTVIKKEEFRNRVEDLGSVIEKKAGVQVRQSGGLGSFSFASLRGAGSEQVSIFLDGVLINDASSGAFDLSTIPLDEIERIEIYRGAVPLPLGAISLGGAINIVTEKIPDGWKGRLKVGAGSFETRQVSGNTSYGGDRSSLLATGGFLESQNDFEITNDNGTAFNPNDDFEERRNNADFTQGNLLLKWDQLFFDDRKLRTTLQFFDKDQGLPDADNSPDASARLDTELYRVQTKLELPNVASDRVDTTGKLYASRKEEIFDDRLGQIGLGKQHDRGITNKYGVEGFTSYRYASAVVRGILDVFEETYEREDLLDQFVTTDSQRRSATLGAEYSHELLQNSLIVSLTLRQQWAKDELKTPQELQNQPESANENSFSFLSPQIGAKYYLNAASTITTNLGKYARIPAFFELFGDRGFLIGNDELKPEKGVNFDFGLQYEWFAPARWYHQARTNIGLFRNEAEDLIVRVFNARGVGRSENVSDSVIHGLELGLSLKPVASTLFSFNATLLDTEIISEIKAFNGNQLPGRFRESYNLTMRHLLRRWEFGLEGAIRRGMFFDTANLLNADDQEIVNLSGTWRRKNFTSELRIQNLFDDRYQEFNGFPAPGRYFLASVTANF